MLCWLTCLITTSAFLPNYLIDYLKLPFAQMSGIMSAIGLGSTVGTLALPWLSDAIGRKPRPITTLGTSPAGGCWKSRFIVEGPPGSRNKYEMDHETGRIRIGRVVARALRKACCVKPAQSKPMP